MTRADKSLTLEVIQEFQDRIHDLRLSTFTSIEDAAADALPQYFKSEMISEGKIHPVFSPLFLQGLNSVSDRSARSLSKHRGYLSLSGLTTISDRTAKMLSRHRDTLHLDGLPTLSDAAAKSLSKHKGYLGLSGLSGLSEAAADAFSNHQGVLDLSGLTSLSDANAKMQRC